MAANRSKWWMLAVTTSATSLVFLDSAVMPLALPSIQKSLHFSDLTLNWVLNAYLLCLAALMLLGGRLSDLWGRKPLYLWGISLFGLGALLCGCSTTRMALLLGRGLQGVGGALTVPTTGALLIATFPEGERARAIGFNTALSALFLIIGPVVGGYLTEYYSWRSLFFLNLPMVIFGICMALWILRPHPLVKAPIHVGSTVCMVLAMTFIVVGLMQGNIWGWGAPGTWILLGIGPLLLVRFVWHSLRIDHPLIDFRLFKNRSFSLAILAIFMVQMIVMVTVVWALYFQKELSFSPSQTGILIFLAVLPVLLMSPLGGYISDKIGPRVPLMVGFLLLTFSLFWLMGTSGVENIPTLIPGLLAFGCGIPLIMAPAMALALSNAPSHLLGAASGISVEIRQIASTFSIALMTAVFHATVEATGSPTTAFVAISCVASLFAIGGLIISLWIPKKKEEK